VLLTIDGKSAALKDCLVRVKILEACCYLLDQSYKSEVKRVKDSFATSQVQSVLVRGVSSLELYVATKKLVPLPLTAG
jgi:hypothetical protein